MLVVHITTKDAAAAAKPSATNYLCSNKLNLYCFKAFPPNKWNLKLVTMLWLP